MSNLDKSDYLSLFREIAGWMESIRCKEPGPYGRWKYNAGMIRPYGLGSSCFAVFTLTDMKLLDKLEAEQREQAVKTLQSWQDPVSGLFKDPLLTESDRKPDAPHTWDHIWRHQTGDSVLALSALGAQPLHPLPEASAPELAGLDTGAWTLKLDWKHPWMNGERWFRAVNGYRKNSGLPEQETEEHLRPAYEAVERHVLDPSTGMPALGGCSDPSDLLGGLFKMMVAYVPVGRPVPYAERAIDFVLAAQRENGDFGKGGMALNWDALWVLRHLSVQLDGQYRFADIVEAGRRLNRMLLRVYRKRDGGFSANPDSCLTHHNSVRISQPLPESDLFGTVMTVRCLLYVYEWENGSFNWEEGA